MVQRIGSLLDFILIALGRWFYSSQTPITITRPPLLPSTAQIQLQYPNTNEFVLILWNDETHSFGEVIETVSEAIECAEELANQVAENIDKKGRDVIEQSSDVAKLRRIASKLNSIGLGVTICSAIQYFHEQTATTIVHW
jgi:hypothetical protein